MAGSGNITVWINSPGGDCVAAAQIYNMLMDYKGDVTVKIDGIAASAASVIAMAGTKVLISPVGMMMIHNPATIAWYSVLGLLELLANGKRMPSAELEKAVNERGISSRTMRTAKSRIGDRLVTEKDSTAWVCYLRD